MNGGDPYYNDSRRRSSDSSKETAVDATMERLRAADNADNTSEDSDKSGAVKVFKRDNNAMSMRDKQTILFDAAGKKVYGCTICDYRTHQKGLLKVSKNIYVNLIN